MKKCFYFLLLSFFYSLSAYSQIITTIAGNDTPGYSGDGGPATASELNNPGHTKTDRFGNIYIADEYNNCIRKINTSGIITTIAGNGAEIHTGDGGPATAAGIARPQSVTIDGAGNIYIAEDSSNITGKSYIRKINTAGIISTVAGNGIPGYSGDGGPATAAGFQSIVDIAIDGLGNIYIADWGDSRIRKINITGIISTVAGGSTGAMGDGGPATAADIGYPTGIAADNFGNIYIAEFYGGWIRKVDTTGIITTIAGNGTSICSVDGGPATAAELYEPLGLAVDDTGNVYIADGECSRIRKVNVAGIITTVAGCGISGSSGNGGLATEADLQGPNAVAIDSAGNIYIVEAEANEIRKVCAKCSGLAIPDIPTSDNVLQIWPVPNDGTFSLFISTPNTEPTQITIINLVGQQIKKITATTNKKVEIQLDVPPGTYFLVANTATGETGSKQVVVNY